MRQVVVLGGGFAGLAAGVALARRGIGVTVLEARGRLGGRAYSFTDRTTGAEVDNGQHALMGCYGHTLSFLRTIGAADKVLRQPRLRVEMRHAQHGAGTIAAGTLPGPLHMVGALLGYRLLSRSEQLRAAVAAMRLMHMRRHRDPRLAEWTVEELMGALGQSDNARRSFWYPLAIATLNETPQRASAAPLAEVLGRAFFGSRADSQFVLPRVGLSQLYTGDARRFIEARGGQVRMQAPVAGLSADADAPITVFLRDGTRMRADACISSVPPRALLELLPAAAQRHPTFHKLAELETSPIVSAHLWFDRAVVDADFVGLIGTTTQWVFNRSRLSGENGAGGQRLSTVISAGRDVVERENASIVDLVAEDLRRMFPAASHAQLLRAVVVKEKHATLAATPAAERLRPAAETPLGALFLAGDWTRTGLPPVIEGAVMSGDRAAACVAGRLGVP